MSACYQILHLGDSSPYRAELERVVYDNVVDLGLNRSRIGIFEEADAAKMNPKIPTVAIFFGYKGAKDSDHPALGPLLRDSISIIPCVNYNLEIESSLPTSILHINAYRLTASGTRIERLATLILENLRLLRSERRLFISYKRSESQSTAIQLYEAFDSAGFDVFLDTRSVPYAADFQGVLWHRMADSDIVVLLDTPQFRVSHWTVQELTQANATSVQILHLLWPKVRPDKSSAFSEFLSLDRSSFRGRTRIGEGAKLSNDTVSTVLIKAEALRARALAARHRSLIDSFCDRARDEGASMIAVQPERYISLELAKGSKIAVVPTIGVPRADRYQEIETAIGKMKSHVDGIWLLYDERGILEKWILHLDWLDSHLPIRSVRISKSSDRLKGGTA